MRSRVSRADRPSADQERHEQLQGIAVQALHGRAAADAELLRATRYAEGSTLMHGGRWAAPSSTTRFSLRKPRGHARPADAEPHARFRPRRCAAATCPPRRRRFTIHSPATRTARPHSLCGQHHSRRAHRSDGATAVGPLALPNLATTGETNNYFVQAPFVLNRWTLDTKVNWSANELNLFGRFSVLDFFTENGPTSAGSCRVSRSARATPAPEAGTPITCRPARPT